MPLKAPPNFAVRGTTNKDFMPLKAPPNFADIGTPRDINLIKAAGGAT